MAPSDKRKRDQEFPLSREDSTKPLAASSLLRNAEEKSFPRGGSSVLTPLELKQVTNEAAGDVLFGNKASTESTGQEKKTKKRKVSRAPNSKKTVEDEKDQFEGLTEHINFKTLKIGSMLLGQITEINNKDIRVSFTDGISGYVSMMNISGQFTGILEALDDNMGGEGVDEENASSDEEDSNKNNKKSSFELPDLHKYFQLGQWLRCSVTLNTALEPQSGKLNKKRLELSIEPAMVNQFTEDDLDRFTVVQCAVKSIEDHGATLDLGVEGFEGFISKKDCHNFDKLLPGSVFLCSVNKRAGRSVTVNLHFTAKSNKISKISTIEALVPGQTIDFLCESVTGKGVAGKVLGLVSGFLGVNNIHSFGEDELKSQFPVGTNVKSKIIASLFSKDGNRTLLLSTLERTVALDNSLKEIDALDAFSVGYVLDSCTVAGRDSEYLYLKLDNDRLGQVHSSRVGDIEATATIKSRVLGYNNVDNLYELSTDPKTLALKYLRSKDIPFGETVTCEITAVSSEGINIKIFGGQFTAFVPPSHISDTRLVYPERKFKIGSKARGKILNVDKRGHIFITLKKSLVNSGDDIKIITSFSDAKQVFESDEKTLAVVQSFRPKGCVLSFFGGIKGFLPTAEVSEVYVKRPEEHLRLNQTVIIKLLQVEEERSRIIATCKVSNDQGKQQKEAIEEMILGRSIIKVTIVEKTKDSLVVEMNEVGLRGVVYAGHLSDSRIEQNRAQLKKMKIGAELEGLVIDKDTRTQVFNMTLKQSLIEDAEKGELPLLYEDVKAKDNQTAMHGYIKSFSAKGLFVAFNGKFVGLVLPSYAVESKEVDISKTFYLNQSVTVYLLRTDDDHHRFLLTLKNPEERANTKRTNGSVNNAVDASVHSLEDLSLGRVVSAKIKGVKKNQLNVILADNLHGRVDISEIFDNYDDIPSKKQPLGNFKSGDIIKVKVIGSHDVKGHKFLPITHMVNKSSVFELTAKKFKVDSSESSTLTISDVSVGDELIGFVNNYSNNSLWLTISPSLKAKISILDLSDDNSTFTESLEGQFPIGSVVKVTVSAVDSDHGYLTVTRRSRCVQGFDDIKVGNRMPASIVKITDRYVLLNLGGNVTGISFAADALDDFSVPLDEAFSGMKNQTIPSEVISIASESKQIRLSLRSKDSKTPLVKSHKDLKQGQIVQALIKSVTDKGIFVYLSSLIEAFVPVSKLSDSYLKDWKQFYKVMQPVTGKVVKSDDDSRILLTLRESEINGDLKIMKTYSDIKVGDIFNGSVKNVTDFGVFVKLDNTLNVSGLAHRSEIAEDLPKDLHSLFGVGDKVKVFVLKVNIAKKQLSLSLKASHFTAKGESIEEGVSDAATKEYEEKYEAAASIEDEDEIMDDVNYSDDDSQTDERVEPCSESKSEIKAVTTGGLSLSAGFDWTTSILDQVQSDYESEDDIENFTEAKRTKRHKNKNKFVEDRTIDINTRAPESVADFERLIMGNPNSSIIWMNYIAFQLQLSEIEKAREVAERALKTISFREETEKLNIWIAMLNLENTFGTEDTLEDVFKRAVQYMDSFLIHTKLLSIYHMSEKFDLEAELYKSTAKKFGSDKVSIWVSWGEFLLSRDLADEARSILSRALKVLPKRSHIEVVRKFAHLEFAKGNPERGRSLFEGLVADAPKRIDLWNVYLDQEIKKNEKNKVENIFERVFAKKISRKQAKFFFNKWLEFEDQQQDIKTAEYVKAKALEYAEAHPKAQSA